MKNKIPQTKEEFLELMKKKSAELGMIELKRSHGEYISINEKDKVWKKIKQLQNVYRKKYFLI